MSELPEQREPLYIDILNNKILLERVCEQCMKCHYCSETFITGFKKGMKTRCAQRAETNDLFPQILAK